MVRIVVVGIEGKMGKEIVAAAAEDGAVRVVAGTTRGGTMGESGGGREDGMPRFRDVEEALRSGDGEVVIDFSAPEGTVAGARASAAAGVPFVSGTTGLTTEQLATVAEAAGRVPVVYARNMSTGVAAVAHALAGLARALGGYDVEIVEAHHRGKADAPSGTAVALAEVIAEAWGVAADGAWSVGRREGGRRVGEIGIHAVRGGGNPGEHAVLFVGDGEEVRLAHRAFGRRAYAEGALRAARFAAAPGRPPGWYGMADVVSAGLD